ncbi:uncharacterized protein LOC113360057 [Papaver somniferum]|uniref:uncharacterized protein LOC113360057 n=1 Tax=Papaver somniferum TaxID=3469 RepID=UPI000E705EC9|nr:uncharacterized protein LOC113360057 [Papaver somniferum]
MALKLDLSKAFDRLEWNFIMFVFKKFGFSNDFCELVYRFTEELVYRFKKSVSSSVLVNGYPGGKFFPTKGIRQVDPMPPYIFIICMEALSKLLIHADSTGKVTGIKVNKKCPSVSHLFFADDSFLFTTANIIQARNLLDTLRIFSDSSGQVVNYQKSGIYFSKKVENEHCKLLARILKVGRITKDDTYLGTPLFFNRSKSFNYQNMLDRVYNRVQGWKAKFLSQAGRTTLICSVTSVMPMYQMMCFLLPKKTLDKLDALQRDLWWQKNKNNGGLYIKVWEFICTSKANGGLGNGKNIEVWSKKWLPRGETPKPKNNECIQLVSKVSDLINNEGGTGWCSSPEEVESRACREATRWMRNRGNERIIFLNDNQNVINNIKRNNFAVNWTSKAILRQA